MKNKFNLFLEIALCPKCRKGRLEEEGENVKCASCHEIFFRNSNDILLFCPRTEIEKQSDKYENLLYIEKYAGVFAYGDKFLGRGQMESLHRTVNELVMTASLQKRPGCILDLGCGVGRATFSSANYLQNCLTIGIDTSEQALILAKKIITEKEVVNIDLSSYGFKANKINGFGLDNVILIQADANSLPFQKNCFDILVNVNLFDRVNDPISLIPHITSVLKPGGKFIFTDPLNWNNQEYREKFSDAISIANFFRQCGLAIDEIFDGIIYREAIDVRSYTDWSTLVISATKV